MSADLLRRAADLIEQRGKAALGGTWSYAEDTHARGEVDPSVWRDSSVGGGGMYIVEGFQGAKHGCEYGRWIAMLGPQVAAPLVAWLRDEADQFERTGGSSWAVDFARTVLGGVPRG